MAASKDTGGSGVVDVEKLGAGTGTGVEFRLEEEDDCAWARARRGSRALRGSTVIRRMIQLCCSVRVSSLFEEFVQLLEWWRALKLALARTGYRGRSRKLEQFLSRFPVFHVEAICPLP